MVAGLSLAVVAMGLLATTAAITLSLLVSASDIPQSERTHHIGIALSDSIRGLTAVGIGLIGLHQSTRHLPWED